MSTVYVLLQKSRDYFEKVDVVGVYTDYDRAFNVLQHYSNIYPQHYYLEPVIVDNSKKLDFITIGK